jgi:NADH:ubiquinone oxidoreductase subunit 6 (subunit J)
MTAQVYFIIFSVLLILAALAVLFTKNLIHAAFVLMLCFMCTAAIFAISGADFLAVAQIMVYVGGILILLIFGVLLTQTNRKTGNAQQNNLLSTNYNRVLGLATAAGMFACLFLVFRKIPFQILEGQHYDTILALPSTVQRLGENLVLLHGPALEIVGVLLLGALIGTGYLAKKTL